MNLVMLPMWVLSGVFFASTNFPDAMQPFIQVLPLTALNDALRAIVNEGQSLAAVRREIAILAAWGVRLVRVVAEAVSLAVNRRLPTAHDPTSRAAPRTTRAGTAAS